MQINKKWLDSQLKKLHVDNDVLDKAIAFKSHVEKLILHKLSSPKWTLIEFFILSIAKHIAEELLCGHLYQFKLNDSQGYRRLLNVIDIKRITQKYNQYYFEKLILLFQLSKSKGLISIYPSIDWLNLFAETKGVFDIPQEIILYYLNESSCTIELEVKSAGMNDFPHTNFAESIRFHHYQLDPNICKEGIAPVERYNISEAANFLNVSEDNLMLLCFQNDFGAYIKEGPFKISRNKSIAITQSTIEELSIPSYPYHYQGMARLLKDSSLFGEVETSLKALYNGADIKVNTQQLDYTLVPIQSSLAEAIQGINKFIILNGHQKITKGHLIFIKQELEAFKIKRTSWGCSLLDLDLSQKKGRSSIKQTRTHALHELIKEIFDKLVGKVTNEEIWNQLRQLAEKGNSIVQEVSSWTAHNACIFWQSQTGKERKMIRKSFQSFLSKLRNKKIPL